MSTWTSSLDRDPALAVPGLCPAQEGHAVGGALAGEQLGVGQTRVVVDREVEVLPAGVPVTAAGLRTERTFAQGPEATELLDVDVDELARSRSRARGTRPLPGAGRPRSRRGARRGAARRRPDASGRRSRGGGTASRRAGYGCRPQDRAHVCPRSRSDRAS